jgi:tetratricopeptide (TPR) repeat protein
MDIRKTNGSSTGSTLSHFALVGLIALLTSGVSRADTCAAAAAIVAAYDSPNTISAAEANSVVARLEKALTQCQDAYLEARIKYRIGVTYFKAGMLEPADAVFSPLASDTDCPPLVRICSSNMTAQICRMLGRDAEALEAFNRLASLAEQRLSLGSEDTNDSVFSRLWCAALFSRAEIYETRRDFAAGTVEYNRLIQALKRRKDPGLLASYGPLAQDRVSQLHLRQGNVEQYMKAAQRLTADYPQYYRTPVVKFETACIKFLKSASEDAEFVNGSFGAPAQAIGYLKSSKTKTSAHELVDTLEQLCQQHGGGYGGIFLQYHYAWLLDTLGQKEKAVEMLARICSADVAAMDSESWREALLETIQEYAKLQFAIMLGERADYTEALGLLGSLRAHPETSHLGELATSVTKSIETLKRELPKDENQQR